MFVKFGYLARLAFYTMASIDKLGIDQCRCEKKMAGFNGCTQLGPPLTIPPTTPFPRICVPGAGKALKAFAGDVGEGVWSLNDSVGAPVSLQLPGSDGMMLQIA